MLYVSLLNICALHFAEHAVDRNNKRPGGQLWLATSAYSAAPLWTCVSEQEQTESTCKDMHMLVEPVPLMSLLGHPESVLP